MSVDSVFFFLLHLLYFGDVVCIREPLFVFGCNFLFQCSHIELWINAIIVVDNLFDGILDIVHWIVLHLSKREHSAASAA